MYKSPKFIFQLFLFAVMVFGAWYVYTYSMGDVIEQEINSEDSSVKILIATQGSEYKDEMTRLLMEHFENEDTYLVIVDVKSIHKLKKVFDATIVIHTWEMWLPPNEVRDFKKELNPNDKVLFLGTSGSGDLVLEGVDAIASASQLSKVQTDFNKIINWLRDQNLEIE